VSGLLKVSMTKEEGPVVAGIVAEGSITAIVCDTGHGVPVVPQ